MTKEKLRAEFAGAFLSIVIAASLLIIVFGISYCSAKDSFEAKETELQAFERHDNDLLDVQKPLYRLGEILILSDGRYVVPVAYHWCGDKWAYDVVKVKVGKR